MTLHTEVHVADHPTETLNGYWRVIGLPEGFVDMLWIGPLTLTEQERLAWREKLPNRVHMPAPKLSGVGFVKNPED